MAPDATPRRRHLGRALLPLGLVFLAVGISMAVAGPFLSLFLSTAVHASPVQVTAYLVAAPLASVVASTLIGRLSDRRAIRRRLLIGASVAGMVSTGLTYVVRDYRVLLVMAVTVTALTGPLFPQTFAYARQVLARDDPDRAALGISTLRTVFSLAWVAGPPLAAVVLHAGGFGYLYGMASALYAVAALVAFCWLDEIEAPAAAPGGTAVPAAGPTGPADPTGPAVPARPDAPGVARGTLLWTAAAFTMLQCPLTLGVQALPLFISRDLGGDPGNAGLMLGLCAALEIPLMLGLGVLATRFPLRRLVLAGAGCGVLYYAMATASSGIWQLAAAQLVNAAFIAAVSGLGISYMQDMLPQHPGQATTLFTNSVPIGAVLAGPLFGLAQHFGFRLAYGIATVLCTAGLLVLLASRPPASARSRRAARPATSPTRQRG
jgi:SET family sugar efflux transporter-like MFS transporter